MNRNYHTISYCCKGAQVQLGTSPTDMGLATWITIQHDNELRDFIHPISIYFPKCNLFVQFFPTHQPLSQSQGRLRAIQSFLAFSVSGWHLAVASFLVRQFKLLFERWLRILHWNRCDTGVVRFVANMLRIDHSTEACSHELRLRLLPLSNDLCNEVGPIVNYPTIKHLAYFGGCFTSSQILKWRYTTINTTGGWSKLYQLSMINYHTS